MFRTLRTMFLVAIVAIMAYWLLAVVSDVYRLGALAMSHLRDGGIFAVLIYVAGMELWRGRRASA